jgi:hypothetical protein
LHPEFLAAIKGDLAIHLFDNSNVAKLLAILWYFCLPFQVDACELWAYPNIFKHFTATALNSEGFVMNPFHPL